MTTGNLDRGLAILEILSESVPGLPMHIIADRLNIPRSATHRLLAELIRHGYVRQEKEQGEYLLTMKLCSLGLSHLSRSGVTDAAQPILERLARASGELARLGIIDGEQLVWVAKAQGAPSGLRYDPDMGREALLSCTASGHAWLSCLSDEEAIELVLKQGGLNRGTTVGPKAAQTIPSLLDELHLTRERGYSILTEAIVGTAATAAPIHHAITKQVIGVLSVSGPNARFTEERMRELTPVLLNCAAELSSISPSLPSFADRNRSPGVL
ncbi:IclR family transcriptional regulator [Telmatospirillum sp.]|uniref:IclR family transcriptional regulator n=1 Tax=Telmatospirillum sp. TaxID=2079197 RepID=UPI002845446A|nr:IclR family transcriptional regulator [Telmatospirillum sp.]MDR3438163.1 IclR family transcriptional regulator [Telmatospirillum sp.]